MSYQLIISFLTFVFLSGITPGPANLTSLATSIQFGKKTALKQWLGLISGCATDVFISVIIVFFLGTALNEYVKWFAFVGVAYLLYMAFKILRANYSKKEQKIENPGFFRGYFLQLTNVKIILMSISSLSSYILPNTQSFLSLLFYSCFLWIILPSCNLIWLFTGVALQRFFINKHKIINIVLAISLCLCAISLAIFPFRN